MVFGAIYVPICKILLGSLCTRYGRYFDRCQQERGMLPLLEQCSCATVNNLPALLLHYLDSNGEVVLLPLLLL
eukprot:c24286_g3_i1 orf=2-217(-)